MFQDFRFAARMLLKQPGFSWIAVFTLALGIGATSAVFSLIQGVLLSPPPYRQPERLALIPSTRNPETGHTRTWAAAQWMDWQKEAKSFEDIAGYSWTFNFLMLAEGSESVEGMWVTPNYFGVMGLKPLLGRTFGSSETGVRPAAEVRRRSKYRGQDRPDQPFGNASYRDRRDAPGRPLPSFPGECPGTQLQHQWHGGFLGSGNRKSGEPEVPHV